MFLVMELVFLLFILKNSLFASFAVGALAASSHWSFMLQDMRDLNLQGKVCLSSRPVHVGL
jgi:hypothetical protein